ncbi:Tetratricopeptide repeat-containing protein [Glycomyces sambucus]|uniref:Tetratricopeptide repeat-containing protein n=1 Tax=Glycomyces sambucus TaxID=380244 RepID=A0A1G9MWN1_9ACTN|nr:tetratricopeptide repeat protein [Glycomyces sambucus]SDL78629.1 Tetratricopeptide repeat-containing protein [Glycomyces sambucus]
MNDDVIGVRGKESSGPRWAAFKELNNTAARLGATGRIAEATAMLREAVEMTYVDDVDAAGLDGRARALGNLAGLAEGQGDTEGALRLAEEALAACYAAESEAGDRYGTVAVRASVLVNRAQTLQLLGRLDEALADLDGALDIVGEGGDGDEGLLAISANNSRSVLLIGLERLEEAEAAAQLTLQLASARDPRLTGHPYSNLAAIAQALNDHETAMAYLLLAEQVHLAAGDPVTAALAVANQGRVAMRMGDTDAGQRLLAAAEQAFSDGEQPLRAAELRYSRAHAAFQAGDPARARELLGPAITVLRDAGHASMLAESLAVQGDIYAAEAACQQAEESYLEAWRVYEAAGARYHLARIDMRRAFAVADWAGRVASPADRERLLRFAFDLSLPSALATDAMRHGFAPGRSRERWAATVAVPAMAHALSLAAALRDGALVSELLEHMSATVSLHAPAPLDYEPFEEEPNLTAPTGGEPLSFTASALVTGTSGDFPATRFALPPRLRVNPWRESQLEPWIQETERRYGFAIRSDEVIETW